jgi:predicted nucleic acid-binding protein
MSSTSYFIDSNIPMYADGSDHPLKAPCLAVLSLVSSKRIAAVTSVETIQEILHRYTLIGRRGHVRQVIDDFLTIVPDVLPVTPADMRLLLSYIEQFPRLSARDLLHVAVMTNNGVTSIVSADTDFDTIPHITRIDPRDQALVNKS